MSVSCVAVSVATPPSVTTTASSAGRCSTVESPSLRYSFSSCDFYASGDYHLNTPKGSVLETPGNGLTDRRIVVLDHRREPLTDYAAGIADPENDSRTTFANRNTGTEELPVSETLPAHNTLHQ